jgi:hypothetical protein
MPSAGIEANEILLALQRQQDEARMLQSLGRCMGVEFHPKSLPLPGGGVMEIDGYSAQANAVCGVCTSQGTLDDAQQEQVLMSALKLDYVAQTLGNTVRQILLFRDANAARAFCSSDRVREAMRDSTLEVCVLAPA